MQAEWIGTTTFVQKDSLIWNLELPESAMKRVLGKQGWKAAAQRTRWADVNEELTGQKDDVGHPGHR